MKKVVILFAIVASVLAISCNNKTETVNNKPIVTDTGKVVLTLKETLKKDTVLGVPVGEKNFQLIASYIEKHGSPVTCGSNDIMCGHQVTFFDKSGNRHAMIVCRVGDDGQPAMKGKFSSISVWGYYKGIKDGKHFFGYNISEKNVCTFRTDSAYMAQNMPAVKKGYEEFLAKVSKSKS